MTTDSYRPSTLSKSVVADLHSTAKKIYVGYKITSVSEVDSLNCTFHIDMKLYYEWDDATLIGEKVGHITLGKKNFDPEMVITNECELKEHHKHIELTDSAKGTVKMCVHLRGSCFMM